MSREIIEFIIDCIEEARDDDLARAKVAFRRYTPAQMEENYGQSGHTCSEILNIYEKHNQKCEEAIEFMRKSKGEL